MRYGMNRLVCAGLALTVLYVLQGGHHNVGVATNDVPRPVLTPRDVLVQLLQKVCVPVTPRRYFMIKLLALSCFYFHHYSIIFARLTKSHETRSSVLIWDLILVPPRDQMPQVGQVVQVPENRRPPNTGVPRS